MPNAAWAKGRRLLSWSWGAWSLHTASMTPSLRPRTIAWRSASERSGGDSLAKVRYSPTAISLRAK